ncbi:metal-dependent hydrolase family protein [Kineococcus sp. SYSU DK003]|uniref:metal-dependent hydrolase family protein n=1 Tax=Kineococcus sp. SYSU DK003 TaxID=3383124 RepID=UPI003D7E06B0
MSAEPGGDLVVRDALVFDGWSPELLEADVRIAGGVVAEIGPRLRVPGGVREVAAAGCVVTPGLIDAHFHAYAVHLHTDAIERTPLSYVALAGQHRLSAALRRGVTTVRDVAGGDAGIAKAIAEGHLASPRYLYTGAALSQSGGHGDWRSVEDPGCAACGGHTCEVVDGVEPLRRTVRERFRQGAHAIKIMTSGGVVSYTDPIRIPQYSPEEIAVVVAEATRRGSYVAAHAYSPEAIVHSVGNGVRSIEHGNLLDGPTAAVMAAADAFLVPTLAAYDAMDRRGVEVGLAPVSRAKNAEVLRSGQEAVEIARAAGVRTGWGSDLMGELADEQLTGLRLQAEVLGPLGALRAATRTNAALLQRDDLGRVEPGARGDLVLWNGNPLEDLAVVWDEKHPRTVVQGGTVLTL